MQSAMNEWMNELVLIMYAHENIILFVTAAKNFFHLIENIVWRELEKKRPPSLSFL